MRVFIPLMIRHEIVKVGNINTVPVIHAFERSKKMIWKIEVDVKVRKTLTLSAPTINESELRDLIHTSLGQNGIDLHTFQAYVTDKYGQRRPVETIIDNNPTIVSIYQIEEM